MNRFVFERDKGRVKESLRTGTIDYLETVSEGSSVMLFEDPGHCLDGLKRIQCP
jgi:hypothetical protein